MPGIWRVVIGCSVVLMSIQGYAEEWVAPMVQVEPTANGWICGEHSKVQWEFDRCNDGEVSAERVSDDSRPGGDGECVEIVCRNSPRGRLFFRNTTDLTIPEGTEWIGVWIKGVKGRAERLEGSFYVVDSQGILEGTMLSLAQPVEIEGDSTWKQYVFQLPELELGVRRWKSDPLSEVHDIAWPLKTGAMGWKLDGQDFVLRMDDWTAGSGKVPEASLVYALDSTRPRALSPEETAETWFNAWINRDRDMVMLYHTARLPGPRRAEWMARYDTKIFPRLMSDRSHAIRIVKLEVEKIKSRGEVKKAFVEVVVKTVGGWSGKKKKEGNYTKTIWRSVNDSASPWYLDGGF